MRLAPARSGLWISVLRTALSMLWQEYSADPVLHDGYCVSRDSFRNRNVGSLRDLVRHCWADWSARHRILRELRNARHPVISALGPARSPAQPPGPHPVSIGRWLARRSPGRELAPCVAFMLLDLVTCGLGVIWEGIPSSLFSDSSSDYLFRFGASLILFMMPVMAGATWIRRKRDVTLSCESIGLVNRSR